MIRFDFLAMSLILCLLSVGAAPAQQNTDKDDTAGKMLSRDLPESILEAVKKEDTQPLRKHAWSGEDFLAVAGAFIELGRMMGTDNPGIVEELAAKMEIEYKAAFDPRLLKEISRIRKLGDSIAFDWGSAVLKGVAALTRKKTEIPCDVSRGKEIDKLILDISSKDKRMTIFADAAMPTDTLRIGDKLIGTALNRTQFTELGAWEPGRDKEVDRTLGQTILDARATAQVLELTGMNRMFGVPGAGATYEMPKEFRGNKIDVILWKNHEKDVELKETGANSLVFKGRLRSDAIIEGQFWETTLTLTPEIAGKIRDLDQFTAIEEVADGVDRPVRGIRRKSFGISSGRKDEVVFSRVPGSANAFNVPGVKSVVVSPTFVPHRVEIVFVNGVADRFVIAGETLRRKGETGELPRKKLPWKHPNPIRTEDIFGP
ncbi:hypothetical protein ACFL4W_02340 [Planctomycetota bacterium]